MSNPRLTLADLARVAANALVEFPAMANEPITVSEVMEFGYVSRLVLADGSISLACVDEDGVEW